MDIVWAAHRDAWGPRGGGAELSAAEIGRALAARGHRFRIYSVAHRGDSWHLRAGALDIRRVPTDVLAHVAWLPFRWADKADVVVEDVAHVVPYGGRVVSRRPGVVSFRHLHRRTLPGQVGPVAAAALTWIERAYSRVYAGWTFVTESASSGRDLRDLGVPAADIRVIPPGIDSGLFRPGVRSPRPTLVYFGGMRGYKRADHAIDVLARLRAMGDDVVLDVIGDGPALESVRAKTRRLAMGPYVTFTGRLTRSELAERVGRAWVNLHCSVSEGWCFSAIEAAAAGVPTAAYRIPGLIDSVADGRSGRLVTDGDQEALAGAAHEILGAVDRWAVPCREHALNFAWDESVASWEKVLADAVARGPHERTV